jgi:3-oxoacyl-[acyl-carrier-protein] synthase-3
VFELETDLPYLAASSGAPQNGDRPHVKRAAAIAGLGVSLPETVVPNAPIAERLGVSSDWITARTGVVERRVAAEGETLVDFAFGAANGAIAEAAIEPTEIDMVLVATCSFDMLCPTASALLAARLGTRHAAAHDINAACSGFLTGLSTAAATIEAGRAHHILVVGADLMHRVIDFDDRSTAGIFADGAGAVVVSACEGASRIGPVLLASDGERGDLVEASRAEAIIHMKGHDTFRQAVERLEEITLAAVASAGVDLTEIDLFAYHQANSRIIEAVGDRLGLDPAKVVDCVPSYGNTSAASIPIALAEARSQDRLGTGDKVLLGAFGGGLTWGAAVVDWSDA